MTFPNRYVFDCKMKDETARKLYRSKPKLEWRYHGELRGLGIFDAGASLAMLRRKHPEYDWRCTKQTAGGRILHFSGSKEHAPTNALERERAKQQGMTP